MRFIYLLFLLPFTASAQCDPEGILLELQATTDLNGLLFGETGCIEAVTIGSPLTFTGGTLDITTGNLTAGSTKVAVTGGTGAVIGSGSTVDVVPGNILLSTLGGTLNLSQINQGGATLNQVMQWNGTTWTPATISTGSGTVTSVALSLPSIFSVSGSPVTTSGTLTGTLATQSANTVLAGPTTGGAATPSFRALVAADIPTLSYVTSVGLSMPSGFSVSGSPVTSSGTLAVTTSLNGPLRGNGSGFTTGNTNLASEVTGTLPIANGGTGLTALGTALQLLRVNSGGTALEYFTPSFLTANQTITLSGDVTGSGTTAITTTIANNAVTVAKMQTLAGLSVLGRSANSTGNMAAITGTAANQYLRVNSGGTALEWGTITAVTGSGAAGQGTYWTGTNTVAGSAAYLVDVTNGRIQTNITGSAVTPTAHYEARVTSGTNDEMFRFVGNVAEVLGILRNDRNVSGAGSSVFEAQVGGANAGDPYTRYTVNGLNQWVVGIDNSDGDAFRILNQANPSSGSVGGEGVRIQTGVTTKVGINKTVAVEVMDVGGNIRGDVIKTQNTATATFAIGTGAGTGGSIDAANTRWRGNGGKCRFTVGTSPVANADVFTMTIGAAYKFTDADPVVSGSLPNSATGFYGFYDNATGKMTVRYSGTLAPGTYWVNFQMIGQ